uniref:Reverse transcriptase zinc-binding domain-containing protein n=1 Tax=Cannabis sativa TaxID=3483 RepID=A0A803NTG8_CANSA
MCPVCSSQVESTSHVFTSCPIALACWRRLRINFVFDPGGSFRSWLELIFQTLPEESVCSVAMVCWSLWMARNKTVWKKKSTFVMEVIASARTGLDQWKKAQDKIALNSLCLEYKGDGAEL